MEHNKNYPGYFNKVRLYFGDGGWIEVYGEAAARAVEVANQWMKEHWRLEHYEKGRLGKYDEETTTREPMYDSTGCPTKAILPGKGK